MAPIKLPRYVIFKGDNGYNLRLFPHQTRNFLQFNSTDRDKWGTHEVIPVSDQEDVVMIKSVHNSKFWETSASPNWVFADKSDKPSNDDKDCLFKVVGINDETVALQNVANGRYLKRYTYNMISCLSAKADSTNDVHARLQVSAALSMRRVFDVDYVVDQMETLKLTPIPLGSTTATNNSSSTRDLPVPVPYDLEKQSSWRMSPTFHTGLSMTVTAGIPDFDSPSGAVSEVFCTTVEMGQMHVDKTHYSTTRTVKDVAPGDTVKVEVLGTKKRAKVPFKYKFQDTRVDGLVLDEETGKDGIFEGEQVIDIKWVVTDSHGTPKQII